jgi:hypothetical protein
VFLQRDVALNARYGIPDRRYGFRNVCYAIASSRYAFPNTHYSFPNVCYAFPNSGYGIPVYWNAIAYIGNKVRENKSILTTDNNTLKLE